MASEDARQTLAGLLRLNTRLFVRCLEGVTEEQAARRPGEGTGGNALGYIALHVADARYYLVEHLGRKLENPFGEYAQVTSNDEVERLPPLDLLRGAWERVSPVVTDAVGSLSSERAGSTAPAAFPIDDPSLLGMVAFLVQHESYHIGQLALLRRQFGLPSLDWT